MGSSGFRATATVVHPAAANTAVGHRARRARRARRDRLCVCDDQAVPAIVHSIQEAFQMPLEPLLEREIDYFASGNGLDIHLALGALLRMAA